MINRGIRTGAFPNEWEPFLYLRAQIRGQVFFFYLWVPHFGILSGFDAFSTAEKKTGW